MGMAVSAILIASIKDAIHVWMLGGAAIGAGIVYASRRTRNLAGQWFGASLILVGIGEILWWEIAEQRRGDDRVIFSLLLYSILGAGVGIEAIAQQAAGDRPRFQFKLRSLLLLMAGVAVGAAAAQSGPVAPGMMLAMVTAAACLYRWRAPPLVWLSLLPLEVLCGLAIQMDLRDAWQSPWVLGIASINVLPAALSVCFVVVAVVIERHLRRRSEVGSPLKKSAVEHNANLLWPRRREPLDVRPQPFTWYGLASLAALLAPLALAAAGIVIYLEMAKTTIKFEIEDPTLKVWFEDQTITVENDGAPIRIRRLGDHRFTVERDGILVHTENFELNQGDRLALRVTTVNGRPQVIADGGPFRKQNRPPAGPDLAQSSNATDGAPSLIEEIRLDGHQDFVLALDFTPDGSRVITGGAEHVFVWSARNGRRERELMGHTRTVHAVVVSQDGKYVAAAGKDNAILVWELATGKTIQRLTGHTGFVECLAFSPDGGRIASGSSNWVRKERGDLTIRLWDVPTGSELWQTAVPPTPQGQGQVYEVHFTPDGRRLATVHHSAKDGVSVWDAETGRLERQFGGPHSSIKCAALSPDGQTLATGHEAMDVRKLAWDDPENAVIRLWSFETGQEIGKLVGHTGGIQSVEFSSDGRRLVSCSGGQFLNDAYRPDSSRDNTVRVWDIATRRELVRQPLQKHGQAAVISPNGRFIASSAGVFNEKPLVQIWRLPESVWPKQTEAHPAPQDHPEEPSEYFQRLAGDELDSVVRERVGGGSKRFFESERIPQAPNRVRYEARIDGVGAKILDNVFVDLKDLLRRGTDAQIVHEGQRGGELRLLRYATPDRNGEVRLTLSSREVGATPAGESTKWRLEIAAREWPRGVSQGSDVIVEIARTDDALVARLDGFAVTPEELLARLNTLAAQDPGLQVRVEGDVVPLRSDVVALMNAIGQTAVGEQNVKFPSQVTQQLIDDASNRGTQMRQRREAN
jgi:WD40 repeat protein